MRRAWDRFARRDPMYYIATRSRPWSEAEFFASGEALVEMVLDRLGPELRRNRMLEIGCGLGRTAIHFTRHFGHVDAADIAPAMVDQARQRHAAVANLAFTLITGRNLEPFSDGAYDLIFSSLVFQHVSDESAIASYLNEAHRVLKPAPHRGIAALQFDTRRLSLPARLYRSLPDPLLPRSHRRYVRRYPRDAARLRELFRAAKLSVRDEWGLDTAEHYFILTRDDALP
jgi:ubiquinone/menaquinone biosynthesis C-methylase UbiE